MGEKTGKRKEKQKDPSRQAQAKATWDKRRKSGADAGPQQQAIESSDFQGAGPAGAPAAPEASRTSQNVSEPPGASSTLQIELPCLMLAQSASFLPDPSAEHASASSSSSAAGPSNVGGIAQHFESPPERGGTELALYSSSDVPYDPWTSPPTPRGRARERRPRGRRPSPDARPRGPPPRPAAPALAAELIRRPQRLRLAGAVHASVSPAPSSADARPSRPAAPPRPPPRRPRS
eukprot:tig00001025_g6360.t1